MSSDLIAAASEINRLHSEICEAAKIGIDKAVRIGELLTEQKANLKHGEFLPWLKANVAFSRQTADNYRHVYELKAQGKLPTVSNLTDAYRLLEAPKNEELSEEEKVTREGQAIQHEFWKLELQWKALEPDASLDNIGRLKLFIEDGKALSVRAVRHWIHCQRELGKILRQQAEVNANAS